MAIDGTYKYVQKTPMGDIEGDFTFKAEGNTLTGRATSPYGAENIQDGKIDGNKLSWIIKAKGPMGEASITFTATINGDNIEGESKMGSFPPNKFTAKRA